MALNGGRSRTRTGDLRRVNMSDGREEREEQERRRQQEEQQDREDRLDRYKDDQWVPERQDS